MNAIPANMRHLPVYITETDQNDAWQNVNAGWIQRAYGEIEWWNRLPDTQVIRALILYRWPNYDRWGLESKTALHEDFRQAMTHKYNWEAAMTTKASTQPAPSTGIAQPAMTDVTNQLSRDAAGYVKRTRADIKYVVINHTAVRSDVGADRVASAQRQRWPGIVSQFFITGDGKIQRTNPDLEVVSRDQAWIFNGLNIYVAGNFDSAVPSDAQLDALARLCAWLVDQYGLKPDAIKGVSEFIQTHSPGLQWLEGARWKDKLLGQVTKLIGSTAPGDATVAELKAEIERLKTQVQTLQSQNKTLSDQVTSLTNANTALKAQVVAAAAEKQALEKRITELEARIAELTKTGQPQPPAIRDITASLPTHATARYDKRTTAAITTVAIHHSAAAGDIPPQNIAAYHVRKGWPGIGYHFYITGDGTIYQCNTLETISYHAGYANTYSVGICLAGSFMGGTQPPEKQFAAAADLVAYLSRKLNIQSQNIKGHKELPETATACPGSDWIEGVKWKDRFVAQVKARTG